MASTWVKLHDDFFDHPKVIGLTPTAIAIHLRAVCWCSKHLSDGRIPVSVVESWGIRRWRDAVTMLAERTLWEPWVDHGSTMGRPWGSDPMVEEWFQIHDYLDYQRSAEEARNIRQKRASAGAKGGKAKAAKAKQTPSKVLEAGLAEKRREDSPSSPPQISWETPNTRAAYGGEEELSEAVVAHMARCDLERERERGTVITNEAGWLRKAAENRSSAHSAAIAHEVSHCDTGAHYALHIEIAETVDPRCGPPDGGRARALAAAEAAEARGAELQSELDAIRSDPDAIKAGAAAARAALRTPAA